MNLNGVYELKERLDAVAIAGVSLIGEDFRLKRAVEQMEPLAKQAPVFGKIYEMAKKLLDPKQSDLVGTLLDVLGLVEAVLCTQGSVQVEGEMKEIEVGGTLAVNAPYSQLAPIKDALKGTGSGRYAVLIEAHEQHPELFLDYRTKNAMIEDLNDNYADIAEQIKQWFIESGDESIVPLLKRSFNPTGKRDMERRVQIIEKLAGARENEFYINSLEKATPDIKKALIHAMRLDKSNTEKLLELVKTENGNIKKQAIWALSFMDSKEASEYFSAIIKKKPKEYIFYLRDTREDWASDIIADLLIEHFNRVVSSKEKKITQEDYEYMQQLLIVAVGKISEKMQKFYRIATEKQDLFMKLRLEKDKVPDFSIRDQYDEYFSHKKQGKKKGFRKTLSDLLTETLLFFDGGTKQMGVFVENLYQTYGKQFLGAKFAFSLLTQEKETVYENYRDWLCLDLPSGETESSFLAKRRGCVITQRDINQIEKSKSYYKRSGAEQIADVFGRMIYSEQEGCYKLIHQPLMDYQREVRIIEHGISSRWYSLLADYILVEPDIQFAISYSCPIRNLIHNFLTPEEEVRRILANALYHSIFLNGGDSSDVLLLKKLGWKDYKGLLLEIVKSSVRMQAWEIHRVLQNIPMSTEEYIEELEEIIKRPFLGENGENQIKKIKCWLEQLKAGVSPQALSY